MPAKNFLAEQFEANRAHLQRVAYRMLGSRSEADDAVQESWLRLSRSDTSDVHNLGGWLTTVVARVCLDMLRSRKSRREETLETYEIDSIISRENAADPEQDAALADSVGLALLVVLQKLTPAERIAFVLHDMFDLPFEEIGPIVSRSPTAARQLASRARRRVRGITKVSDSDLADQQRVIDAFLAASRQGDLNALLAVLDPDIVCRADQAAMQLGSPAEIRGAAAVANALLGRAQAARSALVDGAAGVVVAPRGRLLLVLDVTIARGRIIEINAVADVARLQHIDLAVLGD